MVARRGSLSGFVLRPFRLCAVDLHLAVSKSGECSPFRIVQRTLIPGIGGMMTMLVLNFIVF
jgi:hypothetical protein